MVNQFLGVDIRMKNYDIIFSPSQDFSFINDRANLKQAILTRLLTDKGTYYNSSNYGSEIYKIYGQALNELTLNRLKGYILEALKQEPRINEIALINIIITNYEKGELEVSITLMPINEQQELNLIFPLFIE